MGNDMFLVDEEAKSTEIDNAVEHDDGSQGNPEYAADQPADQSDIFNDDVELLKNALRQTNKEIGRVASTGLTHMLFTLYPSSVQEGRMGSGNGHDSGFASAHIASSSRTTAMS